MELKVVGDRFIFERGGKTVEFSLTNDGIILSTSRFDITWLSFTKDGVPVGTLFIPFTKSETERQSRQE